MKRKYPVVVFKGNGLNNALYQDLILLKATLIDRD